MKKIWIFIFKIAIAALIIFYLIHNHLDSFRTGIKNFNIIWLVPALAVLYFEMLSCAVRWFLLLKIANLKISLRESISLTMRGYFCSLILPGGAIGGDVAKIGLIAHSKQKGERFEPGLSILVDRIIGMIALFATAIMLLIIDRNTLLKIDLSSIGIAPVHNKYVIILAITGCLAGIGAAFVFFAYNVFARIPFIKFILDKADKITRGLGKRIQLAITMYTGHWKGLFYLTIGSIFFVHLVQMFILYFIACGLRIAVPSLLTLTTAMIIGNIAGLIPLTPGGIGLRDITILAILSAGGFNAASVIPLLMSLVLIIGNLGAGIFFFDKGLSRTATNNDNIRNGCRI